MILLIILIIAIGLSSNFVWNVEIQVEENQELENIAEDIANAGLKTGELKTKINTKEVINKIRLERSDIAGMGIELKGTNAIVKIVKADEKPEIIDENEYCSIISDKIGVITKINAQTGTANVKVGDTVNIGDILINGWMEGKYTGIRYVHAKGEIEAKVWHTKYKRVLYNTTEKIDTGEIENKYAIKINNFKINLNKGVSKFEIYDTIETENKIKLFSDFYLPISIIKTTNKEVKKEEKTYNLEEAKNLGVQELEQELDGEIEDETKIVNKNINTYEDQEGVDIYVTYEVLENIGTNEKIVF
jgi:similar to stage IV sporulation protein